MFDAQHQADFADRSKIMPARAVTAPKPIGHKNNMPGRNSLKTKRQSASPKAPPIAMEKLLVELTGIEPVASWLQTRRSPS
jgi:hypothetical protein